MSFLFIGGKHFASSTFAVSFKNGNENLSQLPLIYVLGGGGNLSS